ncbi:MAG: hypothetical protein K0S97_2452 [Chloroflexota bacterium]|nr:hypothetical protein [Chloroflexota bacterium]
MRIVIEFDHPPIKRRRRLLAVLLACIALIVPAVAVANHQFTDVPTDHLFHDDIAKAYGARLTTGCTATTFCPGANVTRGQMTAFLNRGLGRVAQSNLSGALTATGANVTLGTVSIQAGNPTGGTAIVLVSASVNVYTTAAGCPCEMRLDLNDQFGSPVSPFVVVDLPAIPAGDNDTDEIVHIQGIAVVPTGVARTYSVIASRTLGTATLVPYGKLDALYVPFNGTGFNPSAVAPAGAGAGETRGE